MNEREIATTLCAVLGAREAILKASPAKCRGARFFAALSGTRALTVLAAFHIYPARAKSGVLKQDGAARDVIEIFE